MKEQKKKQHTQMHIIAYTLWHLGSFAFKIKTNQNEKK